MESKMIDRTNLRIKMIESRIKSLTERLEAMTRELKEAVAKYDTYSIVTFVPGRISQIEKLDQEIKTLEEEKRMLVWIRGEEEDA